MSKAMDKLRKLRKDRDMEEVKELSERKNSYSQGQKEKVYKDGVKVIKASDIKGEFTFRILPPSFETDSKTRHWAFTIETHFQVGVNKKTFHCPQRNLNKKCPLCEAANAEEDKDKRKKFYPTYGALTWIIDRADEEAGPKLLRMPFTLENEILTQIARAEIKYVDDEEEGFDVTVAYTKEKDQAWGKWSSPTIARRESPISDDDEEMEEWLEYIIENPLNEICIHHPYDVIKAAFDGTEEIGNGDDDEEEEEKPKKKSSFKKKFKKF